MFVYLHSQTQTLKTMSKSNIIEKVRKLLSLSQDESATQGEIENALMFAQRLMIKHNIDMVNTGMSSLDVEELKIEDECKSGESKTMFFSLLDVIARANNCRCVRSGCTGHYYYRIIGFYEDRTIVFDTFNKVLPVLRNLTKSRYLKSDRSIGRTTFVKSYQSGFISGLKTKLKADKAEFLKLEDGNAYQLIVVKKDNLIGNWITDKFKKIKTAKTGGSNLNGKAYSLGRQDGSQQTLANQIG